MAHVIELSDDEDISEIIPISKSKHKYNKKIFKCLNPDCRSSLNLVRASDQIRKFYGLEAYKKKTRICKNCLACTETQKTALTYMIKSGKNLFGKEIALCKKTVVLPESESDQTDDEVSDVDTEFEYDFSEIADFQSNNDKNSGNQLEDLHNVILDIISELNLNKHLLEGEKLTEARLKQAEKDFDNLNLEFNSIEKGLDKLRNDFYSSFQMEVKFLPPLEIGHFEHTAHSGDAEVIAEPVTSTVTNLPPTGILKRPILNVGDKVYIMRHTKLSKWVPAKVISIELSVDLSDKFFKIEYYKNDKNVAELVIGAKNIAYFMECPTRIPVGTRVIAALGPNNPLFVGIIAESPSAANKYRYLIFFDNGYSQYARHSSVRVVVNCSSPEWHDVEFDSREFVKNYLQMYPERPMLRLQKFNYVKMELDGKWWRAQVMEVDCSLVKMYFPLQDKTEWIYRGSTRLGPLFDKKINMKIKSEFPNKIVRRRTIPANKAGPVVEYINIADERNDEKATEKQVEKRSVARKSTNTRFKVNIESVQEQLINESKGMYSTTILPIHSHLAKFGPHQCTSKCIAENNDIMRAKDTGPLLKPLLQGWNRQVGLQKTSKLTKKFCNYVAPCGRRLRSLDEILRYLRLTKSKLRIDYFTTDPIINPRREWEPATKQVYIKDITDNKEDVFISCVNSIGNENPAKFVYTNVRIPTEKVLLNLDPRYLVCCTCQDDCADKTLCECLNLTIEAADASPQNRNSIGYKFKRLNNQVITGIYECNSRCRCKSSCLNRVVQFPVQQKLQLFKTAKRGWGVRTLHDIPKGTFICDYVGKVLTETEANEDGMTDGADDYYANLDFIEAVEGMKEGYESEVEDIDELMRTSKKSSVGANDDNEFNLNGDESGRKRKSTRIEKDLEFHTKTRETRRKSNSVFATKQISIDNDNESDDSSDSQNRRQPKHFEPNPQASVFLLSKCHKRSMRDYYSTEESVYVMDAKVTGNIGRYLNHSCNPNAFVQNVFVDTHDPRFPWIAFFAGQNIKAGMELTWDYNYEVGSVPGKMKYCYCRSTNCRGRLL